MTTPPKYEDLVLKVAELEWRESSLLESLTDKREEYNKLGDRYDDLQQRLTVAEQRAGVMEKALMRIARPHDCGCLPCTGDCTSKLSLEITVDGMRETAELALKGLCETCHDQGEIFVSKGKFEYGMESEPDPIYKQCPVCSKAALKPAAEGEGS